LATSDPTLLSERAFDRLTAAKPMQGERTDLTSPHFAGKLSRGEEDKRRRLRAVTRAPQSIRRLFDQGLLAVDLAGKFRFSGNCGRA
jgi:hypothetical protein